MTQKQLNPLQANTLCLLFALALTSGLLSGCTSASAPAFTKLEKAFLHPPDSARPGVYWYFMDGNLSREAMTKDLESMKKAGLGYLVYLEVNVGVPRGKTDFLSDEWKALFKHAVEECERLGIAITLGVGPGWTGSGGPWVQSEASMRHLVASSVEVKGGSRQQIHLPKPPPRRPFFGEGAFTPEVRKQWESYYQDVAVLAFPTPHNQTPISDADEKALYYRAPYSSQPGVKQFLPPSTTPYPSATSGAIPSAGILDLTALLDSDGSITWDAPKGQWTVMRFGCRNNGAVTRPAPLPGVGLEADKFDTTALNAHLDRFTGELFRILGPRNHRLPGGLKMLHMDSWEMGAQNWSDHFRQEFIRRRKYDPQPFYPVYAGLVVESREISERFLWDLRLTSQELILENHAGHIKEYGRRYGYGLSIEPYDMNPTADLELAVVADMPMCEFWSVGRGFNTSFSAMEGSSAAHLIGQPVVPAEAFTAGLDGWRQHPGSMKNQSDWAFASGINRLVYHTFQHQALDDHLRPGMTMGRYGVHWDRNQTWWPMADAYHRYVARCQLMLQQGRTVADILYLTPENAPHVFRAPQSALAGEEPFLPDRKGYSFDGCPPSLLYRATVQGNRIVFPSGASYRLLVMPDYETMTPELLRKIKELVMEGATVVGLPPVKAPGLTGYPACDQELEVLVRELWGESEIPPHLTTRTVGKGEITWGIELREQADNLYPDYRLTAGILSSKNLPEDFATGAPVRYTHRTLPEGDLYFVANRSDRRISDLCFFRIEDSSPELWDPMTGKTRLLPEYTARDQGIEIPLTFEPHESFFIVFRKKATAPGGQNFYPQKKIASLDAPWDVSFDPAWGGPENIRFERLTDWTQHPNEGIKYYSGTAVYKQTFDLPEKPEGKLFLNLGTVRNIARIRLNGKVVGTVWTSPWQIEITDHVRTRSNKLEIEVINLWANRLIGDEQLPDDGIQHGQWPEWLLNGTPRTSGRFTFTTQRHYQKDSPLLESGLIGPVTIGATDK
jgi:hypothetical protein